ncbi:hypothetical protein VNI00_018636 [Paramarasmius palmivorus]|uniref:Uncharacterized protein n=1 Tax=Paramarasmius palmivorus TaxID=297713 RepID=A0AAW0AWY7_9AGAR
MEYYDEEAARERLVSWIQIRSSAEHAKHNVSKLLQDTQEAQAMECGIPHAWRLVTAVKEPEELVFKVQGVVVCSELPPFTKHLGRRKQLGFLRQGITLTGLGLSEFDDAVLGIKIGDLLLKRNVPAQGLETLNCFGEFRGAQTIHLSNRYFTPRHLAKGETPIQFGPEVDPAKVLQSASSPEFIHIRENVVEYEKALGEEKTDLRFERVSPALFRLGDIVEAQFTLMMVQPRRALYKTIPVLRAITLLDDHFSKQLDVQAIRNADAERKQGSSRQAYTLKRRAGNWDEVEGTAAKQLRKMKISERNP